MNTELHFLETLNFSNTKCFKAKKSVYKFLHDTAQISKSYAIIKVF